MWPALDCLGLPEVHSGKGPEGSRLSTEPPETSEKPLLPRFPEAESLACREIAGEHPSG